MHHLSSQRRPPPDGRNTLARLNSNYWLRYIIDSGPSGSLPSSPPGACDDDVRMDRSLGAAMTSLSKRTVRARNKKPRNFSCSYIPRTTRTSQPSDHICLMYFQVPCKHLWLIKSQNLKRPCPKPCVLITCVYLCKYFTVCSCIYTFFRNCKGMW